MPTTAGTGSEVDADLGHHLRGRGQARRQRPAADRRLSRCSIAELTVGLPRHVTAATGIDAIVHAVEAYTSARLKNPLSDAVRASRRCELLTANLVRACDQPDDREARAAMLLGAHLAGLAFSNAPVAGVHALAYPLGGLHHLPHGLSNALMLRPVLEHNARPRASFMPSLAPIIDPGCERAGTQGRVRALDRRARAAVRARPASPLRLRDHGIARRR